MNISIFLLLSFTFLAAAKKNPGEKCPYRLTVDLTNQTNFHNGSYVYQNVLIPREKQSFYNYHQLFMNKPVPVPSHLRGCVCYRRKPCIKLCCEKNEIFSTKTFKCEKITQDLKIKWDLIVRPFNGTQKIYNVFEKFIYQVGVPCEKPEPLILDVDKWILLESGEIYIEHEQSYLNTINYCLTPYNTNVSEEYTLMAYSCPLKTETKWTVLANTYAMALSVLFLIVTIVVYIILKELRDNLRGKLLICYLICLVVSYTILSFINVSRTIYEHTFAYINCSILGYTCYFFFMAAFLWLSVLCYDIWNNFKENNIEVNARENNKRFIYYSLHAWGWSSIFTLLTIWAQLSPSIEKLYKPGIGIEMCWINSYKWSAAIYFYGPNSIILLVNFVTFTYLTAHIYKIRRNSAEIAHKERLFHENAIVILRLYMIMGISWIFDTLSYCLPDAVEWQCMFIISDLLNALKGFSIFMLFVWKRSILNLLKKRFITEKSLQPGENALPLTTNSTKLKTSCSIESSI